MVIFYIGKQCSNVWNQLKKFVKTEDLNLALKVICYIKSILCAIYFFLKFMSLSMAKVESSRDNKHFFWKKKNQNSYVVIWKSLPTDYNYKYIFLWTSCKTFLMFVNGSDRFFVFFLTQWHNFVEDSKMIINYPLAVVKFSLELLLRIT